MAVTIKTGISQKADVKALAEIYAECFTNTCGWDPEGIETLLSNEGVVAVIAENYAGFGIIRSVQGDAEILTLAIRRNLRRKGAGAAIVSVMCDWAQKHDAERISLEVRPSNEAAIALYKKFNFKPLTRLRGDYYKNPDGTYEDALVMQWTVA